MIIKLYAQASKHPTQQARDIDPMLFYCLADVEDGGPALKQHWVNVLCLLGTYR